MNERILLFIPAYRCADQISRVIGQLDPRVQELVHEVIVVDNRSPDDTAERAAEALRRTVTEIPWTVLRNDDNYGLGGSHKTAIAYGLSHGHDHLLVLHGDDQADVHDIVSLLAARAHHDADAMLGARFMRRSQLRGYSLVRTLGNHAYNVLFSLAGRQRLHDLGSGLNLFRLSRFADGTYLRFADDLTFNYYLSLFMVERKWRMRFFPITWREEDQRSNVRLVQQGMQVLGIVGAFARDRAAFFAAEHRAAPRPAYTAAAIARSEALR